MTVKKTQQSTADFTTLAQRTRELSSESQEPATAAPRVQRTPQQEVRAFIAAVASSPFSAEAQRVNIRAMGDGTTKDQALLNICSEMLNLPTSRPVRNNSVAYKVADAIVGPFDEIAKLFR